MKQTSTKELIKIITASSVGTLIEWYDFFVFGSLSVIISERFFPKDNPAAAFLATLATYAAGLVVRPFGALFFGRLDDLIFGIITLVFITPIASIGLCLFGKYALEGEYAG